MVRFRKLETESDKDIDEVNEHKECNKVLDMFLETLENNVRKFKKSGRKSWLAQEILKKMKERRKHKNSVKAKTR